MICGMGVIAGAAAVAAQFEIMCPNRWNRKRLKPFDKPTVCIAGGLSPRQCTAIDHLTASAVFHQHYTYLPEHYSYFFLI